MVPLKKRSDWQLLLQGRMKQSSLLVQLKLLFSCRAGVGERVVPEVGPVDEGCRAYRF
jgi:hypothetical protein